MSCAAVCAPPSGLGRHHGFPSSPSTVCRRRGRASYTIRACANSGDADDSGGGLLPRMVLHDSLEAAGVVTDHARAAREGFATQIGRLTRLNAETSIAISRGADLARAALCIAAEDDSLVSHSSVPLPVDAFIARLDDLSTGFLAAGFLPPSGAPPEVFFDHLDRYLYVHKGFRRTNVASDARAMYLHSTLTCRSGSALMLSLIYSEMLKTLRLYGLLDFDEEISFPHDLDGCPRGYDKRRSKFCDEPNIMTAKSLLVEAAVKQGHVAI
ncbi:unnamed protein product [Triticum turgidum subsp. durum]|uniref:Protein SirB1 N-terminal domain-containing protein n=1 Tax=Triticum turgidum subsp. durum TaxID=4567 RepID=A0A9R0RHD6_TRITD|nr:unnamed protein product [Triticum turgidum subsp. durum]